MALMALHHLQIPSISSPLHLATNKYNLPIAGHQPPNLKISASNFMAILLKSTA